MIKSVTGQAEYGGTFAVQFGLPMAPGAESELKSAIDDLYDAIAHSPQVGLLASMPAVVTYEGTDDDLAEIILEFVAVPGRSSFEAVGRAGAVVDSLLELVGCQTPPASRVGVIAMEYL